MLFNNPRAAVEGGAASARLLPRVALAAQHAPQVGAAPAAVATGTAVAPEALKVGDAALDGLTHSTIRDTLAHADDHAHSGREV